MNLEIRKLTKELADDYVHFFDVTPHDTYVDEHKCYCVCWSKDHYGGKDFSTVEKRRNFAYDFVRNGNIQGYLAYLDNKVVGWCNANAKSDCLNCVGWVFFMDHVPIEKVEDNIKVKSVFCFVISPEYKRQGIATALLKRVCDDALNEGYDYVEAYPYVEWGYQSSDFGGYLEMYLKNGFYIHLDTTKGPIVRKKLKVE